MAFAEMTTPLMVKINVVKLLNAKLYFLFFFLIIEAFSLDYTVT